MVAFVFLVSIGPCGDETCLHHCLLSLELSFENLRLVVDREPVLIFHLEIDKEKHNETTLHMFDYIVPL